MSRACGRRSGRACSRSAPAATTDAVVVARLRAAGAIVVGKTNLPEFAAEGFTSNDLFGTTRNPWNLERTCGGSSGGSAVALATGMAAIATATDGGGSVRIPAAYCGLVGLKPTNGVIGRDPIPDWIDLSTDGPFSTQADDLEVLLDVLRGPTPGDPSTQEARPSDRDPSIGRVFSIERFTDFGPLPAEAAEPFAAASARFAEVFDRAIEPVTPSELFGDRRIDDDWFTICGVEHAHLFGRAWFDEHLDELTPSIRYFFEGGFACPMEEYQAARRRRFEYVRALDELLGDDGVLVSPVMATDACPAEGCGGGHRCRTVRLRRAEHHRPSRVVRARGVLSQRRALRSPGHRAPVPRRSAARRRQTMGTSAAVAVDRARIRAVRLDATQSRSHTAASAA